MQSSAIRFNRCLLHILKPAYTNQESVSFEKRYRQVHQKYEDFKNEVILVKKIKPALYIHKIVTKHNHLQGLLPEQV
jgi:hypothetical protein